MITLHKYSKDIFMLSNDFEKFQFHEAQKSSDTNMSNNMKMYFEYFWIIN